MKSVSKGVVSEWLHYLGCTPTAVSDDDTEWHLEFDYPAGRGHRMHVVQPRGKDQQIVVATGVNVSHDHLKAFDELDDDQKKEFGISLRRVLNRPEVEFQLDGNPGPTECPKRFQLHRNRFADGLSLDSFAATLGDVFKAELHAIWHFENELGDHRNGFGGKFDFRRAGL